ncbi:hypothetical protein ACEWY4_013814 [Coilia grayii]|uniref:Uncharacterized protein n=1 Tax=Coilia grayii TaxID=363190 RepID=A0ABD1JXD4_9TELE
MQELTSSGEVGVDVEDLYSISSVSPCSLEDPLPLRLIDAGEMTTKLAAGHSQENLNISPLHISPLEAIRELDEAEEALSGLRSPGDGAVRAKDQLVMKELPLRSVESETDELAFEDCEETDIHSSVIVKPLRSIITSKNTAILEAPQSETCHSLQGISDLVGLQEDSQKCTPQKSLGPGGVHKEMLGTSSTLERTIVIIGSELDDTGSSVSFLGGQRDKHRHTNPGVPMERCELRNSTSSTTDLEENKAEVLLQDGVCISKRDCTIEDCNSTLIDILTACKTKVEQLEQLKCSSYELTIQLQSAQALAVQLQQRVVSLEEECCRRHREVQGLQEELWEAQRALQERSAHTDRISEELRLLRLQLQKRPSASGSSEVQELLRGHTHTPYTGAQPGSSRVCTLL